MLPLPKDLNDTGRRIPSLVKSHQPRPFSPTHTAGDEKGGDKIS